MINRALKAAVKWAEELDAEKTALKSNMLEFVNAEERCCKPYQQAELAENTAIKFKKLLEEK